MVADAVMLCFIKIQLLNPFYLLLLQLVNDWIIVELLELLFKLFLASEGGHDRKTTY